MTIYSYPHGRPAKDVTVNQILSLRSLHYSWTKISELLGVSRSTVYRRLLDGGVSTNDNTDISSSDLDDVLREIKKDFPNDGEVLLKSHLLRIGIKVTRQNLRTSIHRVDHDNTVARQSKVVKRRVYSVEHPNALWHMDSHHKLIKWRFVTHAAIDGFSRTITYINCSNNNKSETVLEHFISGVRCFGLPQRIRSDHGGENIKVWRHMLEAYNFDTSRVLTGSSTHNERIERLWRDVHRSVTVTYAEIFRCLESEGALDPLNEVDLYCLHFVYMPRICKQLSEFQESWNMHSLSTEGSKTPYQLFFEGLNCHVPHDLGDSSNTTPDQIDRQSNSSDNTPDQVDLQSNDPVHVPMNSFEPCPILLSLMLSLDPLSASNKNGKDLFTQAINLCGQHLQNGCSQCC